MQKANEHEVGKVMAEVRVEVRVEAAKRADRFEPDVFRFCWIVDFPMYEKADNGTTAFSHNQFSMPQGGLKALRTQDSLEILAWQYDIVYNSIELSSGAVRNHSPEVLIKPLVKSGQNR